MSEKPKKPKKSAEFDAKTASFAELVEIVLDGWQTAGLLLDIHAGHALIIRGLASELTKEPGQPALWREIRTAFTEIVKTIGANNDEISRLFKDLDAELRAGPVRHKTKP